MATVLDTLREIHQIRTELSDLRMQIKRAPLQLKAKENEVEQLKARIGTEQAAAKAVRVDADGRELALKQSESRIQELKLKLNQCESNKEYQVIQDEIKRIISDNDKRQDEILEKITEEEAKRDAIKLLDQDLAKLLDEFGKLKGVVDYKVEKLKAQIEILSTKQKELEGELGPSLGEYQKLTNMKGDAGIAGCEGGVCQGCFSEQTPQNWQELLVGRPTKCNNCGALLFKA